MFEQALILRAGLEDNIDVGLLAETLFFYGSAQLLLDQRSVRALAMKTPSGDLLSLLERDGVKVSYVRQNFAVVTAGQPSTHEFVNIKLGGRAKRKIVDYRDEICASIETDLGTTKQIRKFAQAIADRVKLHHFLNVPGGENAKLDSARSDVRDPVFTRNAAERVLHHLVPTYKLPSQFKFGQFGSQGATGTFGPGGFIMQNARGTSLPN